MSRNVNRKFYFLYRFFFLFLVLDVYYSKFNRELLDKKHWTNFEHLFEKLFKISPSKNCKNINVKIVEKNREFLYIL